MNHKELLERIALTHPNRVELAYPVIQISPLVKNLHGELDKVLQKNIPGRAIYGLLHTLDVPVFITVGPWYQSTFIHLPSDIRTPIRIPLVVKPARFA